MIKKNIGYILMCLVLLIISSLIYVIKYDIKEFSNGSDSAGIIQTNLGILSSRVLQNKMQAARDTYNNYWQIIYTQHIDNSNLLSNCTGNFLQYMDEIRQSLVNHNSASPVCNQFTLEDLYTMNLNSNDNIVSNERLKGICRSRMLNNNTDLDTLIGDYNFNQTTTDRCTFLNNNV